MRFWQAACWPSCFETTGHACSAAGLLRWQWLSLLPPLFLVWAVLVPSANRALFLLLWSVQPLIIAAMLLQTAYWGARSWTFCRNRIVRMVALLSYSLYLYHPLGSKIIYLLHIPHNGIASALLVPLMAVASYRLIEVPFMRMRDHSEPPSETSPGTCLCHKWERFPLSRMQLQAGVASIVVVGCLAAIFYVYSRPSRNGFGPEHDFVTVIAGVHCAIDRCDPYDSPTLEREFPKMGGYIPTSHFKPEWPVYPPSTFLLLLPFSLLPWPVLSAVWMLLSFGFLSAAFVVLFLRFQAYRDLLSVLPFVLLLADGSIGWAVQLGQPALIAASSLTLAIVALESGSMPAVGGLLLAISLCLKPQGAYLCAFYFLLKARTRVAGPGGVHIHRGRGRRRHPAVLFPTLLFRLPRPSLGESQTRHGARKRRGLLPAERRLSQFS